jgi:uncharacterized protein YpmS
MGTLKLIALIVLIISIISIILLERNEKKRKEDLDNIPLKVRLFQSGMHASQENKYIDRYIAEQQLSREMNHY